MKQLNWLLTCIYERANKEAESINPFGTSYLDWLSLLTFITINGTDI